jgi:hypothetical protein
MEFGMIIMTSLVMTILSNRGLSGSTEKPVKSDGPKEESKLRPPNLFVPKELPKPSGPISPPPNLPEWAKSALKEPLAEPKHFAQAPIDTYPELSRGPPAPVLPVNYYKPVYDTGKVESSSVAPAPAPAAAMAPAPAAPTKIVSKLPTSPLEPETTRKISLASPKTSRRKKEMASELNLDF